MTCRRVHSCAGAVILKRILCAKDLPRCFKLEYRRRGSFTRKPEHGPRSRTSASVLRHSREILRAKDALQDDKWKSRISALETNSAVNTSERKIQHAPTAFCQDKDNPFMTTDSVREFCISLPHATEQI